MSQWLKYIRWYYTVAVAPDLSFEDFIKAPVVTTHWKVRNEDPHLVRFGLLTGSSGKSVVGKGTAVSVFVLESETESKG